MSGTSIIAKISLSLNAFYWRQIFALDSVINPVLNDHSKTDKTKVLTTNGSL